MKKWNFLILILSLIFALIGCNSGNTEHSSNVLSVTDSVKVNGRSISIEEINSGIKAVFCKDLYYYPDGSMKPFFNNTVEYELFFAPSNRSLPKIYMIVTNMEHPSSTEQSPKLYRFGISITEYGLQSDFYEQGAVPSPQEDWLVSLPEGTIYLGHHTMCISEIVPPEYETMSDQWKQRAENAIRLYMDNNDFYGENSKNLQAGKYNVYIKGFSVCDVDSVVVFEHEGGQVYRGWYYFVHEIAEGSPADLNHVELIENIDTDTIEYLDKLRMNAALHMEYTVEID